ncbi:hypothetical protein [Litoribacter populi]|uniref:hypothetical protein n=1 Tax=Litoribacter populi TaxID=2598460 RepID=UPI00117D2568|nr:hypothetical protein [Litoribacter populi]
MKKLLAILSLAILTGCGNKIMTKPVGQVMVVTDKTVTVYYEVVTRNYGDMVGNTYYFEEGHNYRVGDVFPKVEP